MASRIERLFENALQERVFSAASVLVGDPEAIIYQEAFGRTRHGYGAMPVTRDTWFDLASLTKPLVTAALCIRAVSMGDLGLDDAIDRFFPGALVPRAKRSITLRQLLSHSSGLPAYEPFYRELIHVAPQQRSLRLLARILDTPLHSPPGTACVYSDLGFILLGVLLESVYAQPLNRLASRFLFQPRRIDSLQFRPAPPPIKSTGRTGADGARGFAATEDCHWRGRVIEGEVHDENAWCLGGVAGHAGLFGTAEGVFRWLSFLWNVHRGTGHGDPAWSPEVMRAFWERQNVVSGSTWALGFDTPSRVNSSAGDRFSRRSIGHLGFTGTSFWVDIERGIAVVLLTNRIHPTRENDGIRRFRPSLHNLVTEVFHASSQ